MTERRQNVFSTFSDLLCVHIRIPAPCGFRADPIWPVFMGFRENRHPARVSFYAPVSLHNWQYDQYSTAQDQDRRSYRGLEDNLLFRNAVPSSAFRSSE